LDFQWPRGRGQLGKPMDADGIIAAAEEIRSRMWLPDA
jgi:hypothetical protein